MTTGLGPAHRWHNDPVPPEDERERLRQTFDRAARLYDRARPGYPEALFDDLIVLAGLTPVRHYDWERVYQAEEYIELLDTFSGHLAMADWKRKRLYGEIRRRLAMRRDHSVRRHWGAVLHVARRREQGAVIKGEGGPVSGTAGSG